MKSAIITGATGQDGYLTQFLLDKGYRVTATHRRSSSTNFWRMRQLGLLGRERLSLIEYDISDACAAIRLIEACEPDEIYNLAAQTHAGTSFQQPLTTSTVNGLGALNLLEATRTVDRRIRYYQASSAAMFGKVQGVPQNEATPFYPRSPYGVSKLFGHWMAVNYGNPTASSPAAASCSPASRRCAGGSSSPAASAWRPWRRRAARRRR